MPQKNTSQSQIALPSSKKFAVGETGLTIHEELTLSDLESIVSQVGRATRACAWILGDILVYGEGRVAQGTLWADIPAQDRIPEKLYKDWSLKTGIDITTLQKWAWIAKNVPPSIRSAHVSHEAHSKVAKLTRDEEKARWIKLAEEASLENAPITSRRLGRSISAGRLVTAEEMLEWDTDQGVNTITHHVNRIFAFERELEKDGWFDRATPDMAIALLKDLRPVTTFQARLAALAR